MDADRKFFPQEAAYRKGVVHGLSLATDGARLGMGSEDIASWCDVCQDWRSDYSSRRNLAITMPPPSGWKKTVDKPRDINVESYVVCFDALVEAADAVMYRCAPGESMESFEARAAEARAVVLNAIMAARVWFMNHKEGGDE
jgi:hypothetical protein